MTLLELFKLNGAVKYGQDKFFHNYDVVYEVLFKEFQDKEINIFEVGYFQGGSCRLWLDYFKKAKVRCIDIDPRKGDKDNPSLIRDNRFKLDIINANDLTPEYFEGFIPDIAIDDGSHLIEDQIRFIKLMYSIMKPGSLIIVEDVQNIDNVRPMLRELDIPMSIVDLRKGITDVTGTEKTTNDDDVLIIIKK
jgi:hypothetical protein